MVWNKKCKSRLVGRESVIHDTECSSGSCTCMLVLLTNERFFFFILHWLPLKSLVMTIIECNLDNAHGGHTTGLYSLK